MSYDPGAGPRPGAGWARSHPEPPPPSPPPTLPLIVAHRARTPEAIENSLSAIRAAAGAGADMVEIDVRLSLDGVPFVLHDALLNRTTLGRGPARLLPAAVLRRIPLRDGAGETIPLLAAALAALGPTLGVALDLKSVGALRAVLGTIRDQGVADRAWLWTTRPQELAQVRRDLPAVRVTLLQGGLGPRRTLPAYVDLAAAAGAAGISIPWSIVAPDAVALAHARGLRVFAVHRPPTPIGRALDAALDGVITADPAGARAALTEAAAGR